MNDNVTSAELLRSSLDITKGFRGAEGNNLQLSDQIQFSSIMKTFVDAPETALEAAQGEPDPFDQLVRPEPVERDRSAPRDDTDSRPDNRDADRAGSDQAPVAEAPRRDNHDDRPKAPEVSKDTRPDDKFSQSDDEVVNEPSAPVVEGEGAEELVTDDFVHLFTRPQAATNDGAVESASLPAAVAGEQATRRATSQPGNAPESHGRVTAQSAANVLSSALTDQDFSNVGDDLHNAVNNSAAERAAKTNTHSAANALANKQAQDLAQKIGQGSQVAVQVTTSDDTTKLRFAPSHTLVNGAQLANLDIDGAGENLLGTSLQRPGANSVAPDRQGPNLHGNGQNGNSQAQMGQQEANAALAQSVRAQAQAMGAQQAAQAANMGAKFQPTITPDAANVAGVNGPAGPSQVSQLAKANPMSAARQPEKPPAPMEQVAVHIKKAFGDGADRINIKLNPAHLGRVEVRMDIGRDGQLSAVILAEKPETLEMLQRDAKGLEKALQAAGLDTDLDSFNFGLQKHAERQGDPSRTRSDGHDGRPSERMDTPEEELDAGLLANQNVYGRNMATNGGVDIRI